MTENQIIKYERKNLDEPPDAYGEGFDIKLNFETIQKILALLK